MRVTKKLLGRLPWWLCLMGALAAPPARAEADAESAGNSQVIPEFDAYVKLSNQARLFLLADVTRSTPQDSTDGELGIHFDYTLKPLLRKALRDEDWERDRYFWVRVGYRHEWNIEGKPSEAVENRIVLELTARSELPDDVWLVNRVHIDFRDIGGTHSNRYRYRIGVEKEFATSGGTAFDLYARAEFFYDTRYDAWSRQVYQLGTEIRLSKSWRFEPYLALQKNTRPPSADTVNQLGLILKYFY
jgi:Protein of unknown function (DUF2490)